MCFLVKLNRELFIWWESYPDNESQNQQKYEENSAIDVDFNMTRITY